VAVEVDPRVTTSEHLETLARLGFNRLSMGVQDLDPEVQALIGRHQTVHQTVDLIEAARDLGFNSINLDLIYGLPGQTLATFERTLDRVIELGPERLAVYSYAHIPETRRHQRRIDASLLPDTEAKFSLLAHLITRLTGAGYVYVGMDHFSLPDDDLARAAADGTLMRNFMGYTTVRGTDVVALGTSGISDVAGAYAQNHRRLASYQEDVDAGEIPTERGVVLTADDLVRRHVITQLMCVAWVDLGEVGQRFDIDGEDYFAAELAELHAPDGLIAEGLASVDGDVVAATDLGRLFVRRLAAVFDAYTADRAGTRPRFSRVV
jgi:oxygen-independent coproporphyrinogen-3 oxidase